MKCFQAFATWCIFGGIAGVLLIYAFWPNFVKMHRLYSREKALCKEIDRLETENQQLRERIYAMEHDPVYIEKVARDELGLSRPDEVIYKFEAKEE